MPALLPASDSSDSSGSAHTHDTSRQPIDYLHLSLQAYVANTAQTWRSEAMHLAQQIYAGVHGSDHRLDLSSAAPRAIEHLPTNVLVHFQHLRSLTCPAGCQPWSIERLVQSAPNLCDLTVHELDDPRRQGLNLASPNLKYVYLPEGTPVRTNLSNPMLCWMGPQSGPMRVDVPNKSSPGFRHGDALLNDMLQRLDTLYKSPLPNSNEQPDPTQVHAANQINHAFCNHLLNVSDHHFAFQNNHRPHLQGKMPVGDRTTLMTTHDGDGASARTTFSFPGLTSGMQVDNYLLKRAGKQPLQTLQQGIEIVGNIAKNLLLPKSLPHQVSTEHVVAGKHLGHFVAKQVPDTCSSLGHSWGCVAAWNLAVQGWKEGKRIQLDMVNPPPLFMTNQEREELETAVQRLGGWEVVRPLVTVYVFPDDGVQKAAEVARHVRPGRTVDLRSMFETFEFSRPGWSGSRQHDNPTETIRYTLAHPPTSEFKNRLLQHLENAHNHAQATFEPPFRTITTRH